MKETLRVRVKENMRVKRGKVKELRRRVEHVRKEGSVKEERKSWKVIVDRGRGGRNKWRKRRERENKKRWRDYSGGGREIGDGRMKEERTKRVVGGGRERKKNVEEKERGVMVKKTKKRKKLIQN